MHRLAAHLLLLTFVGAGAAPCLAADNSDDSGGDFVTVTSTTAGGVEAISLNGPKATIVARSISLAVGGQAMKITPCNKGIQLRFGPHVMRATDLQFRTMPEIKTLELLKLQVKPKN